MKQLLGESSPVQELVPKPYVSMEPLPIVLQHHGCPEFLMQSMDLSDLLISEWSEADKTFEGLIGYLGEFPKDKMPVAQEEIEKLRSIREAFKTMLVDIRTRLGHVGYQR
jgi:hypothetical protein